MELYIIRHGETIDNLRRVIQGHIPGELSQLGREQAFNVRKEIDNVAFDAIYCSDLKRAVDTCNIIFSDREGVKIVKDSRLRERYYGSMQGKTIERGLDYNGEFEGVEPITELICRVSSFVDDLKVNYLEGKVAVVTHGVTIRAFVSLLNDVENISEIKTVCNCEIVKFEI